MTSKSGGSAALIRSIASLSLYERCSSQCLGSLRPVECRSRLIAFSSNCKHLSYYFSLTCACGAPFFSDTVVGLSTCGATTGGCDVASNCFGLMLFFSMNSRTSLKENY